MTSKLLKSFETLTHTIDVDITDLANGLYILTVSTDEKYYIQQLTKC
jgi:hypothetical protein